MRALRHRQLHNPEIQENFEDIEGSLSELQLDDVLTGAEVKGIPKKVAVRSSTGALIGYIPVYPE